MNVHGRRDDQRRRARERGRGQQIVGDPVGDLRHDICRAGSDQEQIGLLGQRDMVDRIGGIVEQSDRLGRGHAAVIDIPRDQLVRERAERERIDEMRGVLGHDDLHAQAAFLQCADDLGGLVRGDAAGDADEHGFLHGTLLRIRGSTW